MNQLESEAMNPAALRARLARIVARTCPGVLSADRDDVVQGAMLRLVRLLDRGALNESYLHKVARSAVVTELRRRRPWSQVPLDDDAQERVPCPRGVDPERSASGRQIAGAIRDGLRGLCDTRRRAVSLYLAGYGVSEAARLLGWGSKKTENATLRGLRDLRDELTRRGVAPEAA